MAMSETVPPAAPDTQLNPRRVIAFTAMVFGMFMAILDIQIVSASLANIQAGLSASSDEVTWVQTAYLIAEVVMIPLSGILGRIFSTRYLFAASAAGFTLMSVLCAFSSSITEIIIWRALQGFIGGGMIPSVFAAAFTIFPANKRSIVSPIIGLVATLAPTIGPTIGGYLTDLFSWHWLFLVNVVPGIAVTVATYTLIDFDKPNLGMMKDFDWWGLTGLALFLGDLEYVLEEGPNKEWFQDEYVSISAVLIVIGAVLFFYRSFTAKQPVVDLRAFANRNFTMGCFLSFMLGVGLYGLTYIYPVYLSAIRSYSALQIGETMFVSGLAMFFTAPVAGRLMTKIDARYLIGFGLVCFAGGVLLSAGITRDWDFYELLIPQILRGVGIMCIMPPINNIALGMLSPERLKGGAGLFNLTRNLGGAFGLAGINTMINKRTDLHLTRLHEMIPAGKAQAEDFLNTLTLAYAHLGPDAILAATKRYMGLVRREAMVMAIGDTFLVLCALYVTLILVVPFISYVRPGGGGGDAH